MQTTEMPSMSAESIAVRKEVWHYQFRTVRDLVQCFEAHGLRWIAPAGDLPARGHRHDGMVRCKSGEAHGTPHSNEADVCDARVVPSMDTTASNQAWNAVQRAAVGRDAVKDGNLKIRTVDKAAVASGHQPGTFCCSLHFEKPRSAPGSKEQ